ncbi:MAG: hypothetical protein NVS1B14_09420 [Vulcanimicrobiaceae bacterium]
MRSSIFCFFLAMSTLAVGMQPAVPAAASSRVAPADEYFGRLKMSILGIRNQLRTLEMRAAYRSESKRALMGQASFIEDAMSEWSRKYPGDPWIPGFRHRLNMVYVRIAVLR